MGRVPPGYGKNVMVVHRKIVIILMLQKGQMLVAKKKLKKPVESEDDVAKQVITSDGASCENFANDEVPATDNLTDMDQNIRKAKTWFKA